MPLYIRDEAVSDLASRLSVMLGKSKTDAVRAALQSAVEAHAARKSLGQRAAPIQAQARQLGLRPDGFDDKPLMDELSGDL